MKRLRRGRTTIDSAGSEAVDEPAADARKMFWTLKPPPTTQPASRVAELHVLRSCLLALGIAVAAIGCSDAPIDAVVCPTPSPPGAPTIVGLGTSARFIEPAELQIEVSDYIDDASDPFLRLEVEIWRGNEQAWRAQTDDPERRQFRLTEGELIGPTATAGTLEAWTDYEVRARYISSASGCESEGPWSVDRTFRTEDGSAAIFDPSIVREYRIDLSTESYQSIDSEAYPPACVPFVRKYYDATLRFEGQTFTNVGAKIKGGCGSSRDLSGKAGMKLNLSWDSPQIAGCPVERRLDGLKHLTFNNMVQDPSMSHELLAYAFYREMGVAAPRATFMKLYVNDDLMGVYLNLESIDRRFLARNFVSNKGMLYEGTYWCDLYETNVHDDDSGCLVREFAPDACGGSPAADQDPLDYQPIRKLIAAIDALPAGGFYPAIAQHVDMESLFSMWAVEAVLAHWDGYVFEIVNNYRIYHDPATDLWTIIPSGVDQTFQRSDLDAWGVSGRLAQLCLAEPACEAAYAAKLKQANAVFISMNMTMRRERWKLDLDGLVVPDPGREFDQNTYEQAHVDTESFITSRPGVITQQLQQHGF